MRPPARQRDFQNIRYRHAEHIVHRAIVIAVNMNGDMSLTQMTEHCGGHFREGRTGQLAEMMKLDADLVEVGEVVRRH